ncbi:multidrug resistance protein-like transporter family ABC domain protein (macronuclear) [Tetrahymena thermophila SB210]|uniref:Multidrug resistance protein-like transporter family ABC domain protein n=1 Tax=Tetrahymena thermophila (strain SB210) TaxID=312017 RepID=I7M9L6_TETTS|nr:multidrug resistance protein-like transporter family ABC domain protein [Tetrahymena thermophila SB210]EAS02072.1 multidrug resistance protein-like transporter family ABC domain protein [Tetrahymena thermophila SB210]|eukprot:XP_001022317.1 multidrug resistance protein-like transporter family ABC domain protein [Tetrahymena thermophila SB210]
MSQNHKIVKINSKLADKNNNSATKNDIQSQTHHKKILQESSGQTQKTKNVSFLQLFRYATTSEIVFMVIGALAAMANGVAFPLFALIFGEMADSFGPQLTGQQVFENAKTQCLYFLYIGIGTFILSWIQMSCWIIAGEKQSIRYRIQYFKAILRQEVGWFDLINLNELTSKIASETNLIQIAIGENVPTYIMNICMTIGGFAVGYARGWQMALITTSALPVLTLGGLAFALTVQMSQKKIANSYEKAGGMAEQGLNAIKTVKSLTGEEFELTNYKTGLVQAFKIACKYAIWAGIGLGLTFATMFLDYALSFWYGSVLVGDSIYNSTYDRDYTQGDVFVIFFAIIIGGFSLGQGAPCIKKFQSGKLAAAKIFEVIDREPQIILPSNPQTIQNLIGNIKFNNASFNYPSKKDSSILRNLNLEIKANQKTAIVGESGCGKSTIMQLLLRFYDIDSGKLTIDGYDVRDLDYNWLRRNIGYVGQEPVLFATTIRENLKFGKDDATEQEMIHALQQANAWEFVSMLQDKLDTYVGNSGSQLSGGQKQRICIARAILKNPQILLLDEATSALDRRNEISIQQTLDQVSKGRTTIVIAHRISTVQNSDNILVIQQGQLIEEGTFEQLIAQNGKFQSLAKNQIQRYASEENQEDLENQLNEEQNSANVKIQCQDSLKKPITKYQLKNETQDQQLDKQTNLSKEEKRILQQQEKSMLKRLHDINKPDKIILYFGIFFALGNGVCFPLSGFLLGEYVDALAHPGADDYKQRTNWLSLGFVFLAIAALVFSTFQSYFFTRFGESLTLRLRQDVYKKMLIMPCEWFDKQENNPGCLSSHLAVNAHQVNGLVSTVISTQFQSISSFITGLVCAFTASWRVSLVALGVSPLMVIAGSLQAKFVQGFSKGSEEAYKDSGIIIMESVTNIRTVASFANEGKILQFYDEKLQKSYNSINKKGNTAGLAFGFSQFVMFATYSIIFICSAAFVRDYGVSMKDMFISVYAIMFAAFGAGNNNQVMNDSGNAKNACKSLFQILDSQDEIQQSQLKENSLIKTGVLGDIEFKNVSFKYPNREAQVFDQLSFTVKRGQKVAFVGPSGSGKSSILQLVMRFYDTYEGQILIDGRDLKSYDLKQFRKSFGIVSQEPILFNGNISENIKYNIEEATQKDIIEAASKANALNFIQSNQFQQKDTQINKNDYGQGFERLVGPKGSQLSGGQKQRIAIARAIARNPNILLLDEATSALDPESEKSVQETLNNFMKDKTTISVAHRISTIKDSDQIFVIEKGKLVEQGTFDQLMANKSYFYRLNAN